MYLLSSSEVLLRPAVSLVSYILWFATIFEIRLDESPYFFDKSFTLDPLLLSTKIAWFLSTWRFISRYLFHFLRERIKRGDKILDYFREPFQRFA